MPGLVCQARTITIAARTRCSASRTTGIRRPVGIRLRLDPGEEAHERGEDVRDHGAQVPRDGRLAAGEGPGLGGQDVHGQQGGGDDPQPSAAVQRGGQRDDGQSDGVEHESLLGPVGDEDPVERDVQHGHEREQGDPGPDRPRPGVSHGPCAKDGREPDRGEPRVEVGQHDIPQRTPFTPGQVIPARTHRVGPVPAGPDRVSQDADVQRISTNCRSARALRRNQ